MPKPVARLPRRAPSGKYMTFKLGDEEYGLDVLKVRDIMQEPEIRRVPATPKFIRGVSVLRGKVIPVIDLHLKFGRGPTVDTEPAVLAVIQHGTGGEARAMTILLDELLEVVTLRLARSIPRQALAPAPSLGSSSLVSETSTGGRSSCWISTASFR